MQWIVWLTSALFAVAGNAAPAGKPAAPAPAQPQPAAAARPAGGELTPDASVDQVLDALHLRGQNLNSFDAKVTLTESDPNTALESTRSGVVRYQKKPDATERIRVIFDKKVEGKRVFNEKIEYMLDGR